MLPVVLPACWQMVVCCTSVACRALARRLCVMEVLGGLRDTAVKAGAQFVTLNCLAAAQPSACLQQAVGEAERAALGTGAVSHHPSVSCTARGQG